MKVTLKSMNPSLLGWYRSHDFEHESFQSEVQELRQRPATAVVEPCPISAAPVCTVTPPSMST